MPKPIKYDNGWKVNFTDRAGKKHQKRFAYDRYVNPKEAAREYIEGSLYGTSAAGSSVLLSGAIREHLRRLEQLQDRRPASIEKNRQHLRTFEAFCLQRLGDGAMVGQVDALLLRHFKLWYFENAPLGTRKRSATYSPKNTWNKYLVSLSGLFKDLIAYRVTDSNPLVLAPDLRSRKVPKPVMRWFRLPEIEAIFGHVDAQGNPHHAAFFRLLCSTGLRAGEAIQLQWSDLDFESDMLYVRRQTKNYRNRTISIAPELKPYLLALPGPRDPGRLVFSRSNGTPVYDHHGWLHLLYRVVRQLNIGHASLHAFRHTFGTYAVRVTDVATVKQLMGHSTLAVTEKYLHTAPEHETAAVLRLGSLIPLGTPARSGSSVA